MSLKNSQTEDLSRGMEPDRLALRDPSGQGSLPISDAYLLDLCEEFDPRRVWELRGMRAHDRDFNTLKDYRRKVLDQFLDDHQLPEQRIERLLWLYRRLLSEPRQLIREVFPGRSFRFVIGVPRTGGHYVLNNLMAMEGLDLSRFTHGLISDYEPVPKVVLSQDRWIRRHHGTMALAQILDWMDRRFPDDAPVFKKRTIFSYVISWLDTVFGDQATYFVTVRHPIPSLASKVQYDHPDRSIEPILRSTHSTMALCREVVLRNADVDPDEFQTLPAWKKHCFRWAIHYKSIVQNGGPEGDVIPLVFGSGLEQRMKQLASRYDREDFSPESFESSRRTYPDLVEEPFVMQVLQDVEATWSREGYSFPLKQLKAE